MDDDDRCVNPSHERSLNALIDARVDRRDFCRFMSLSAAAVGAQIASTSSLSAKEYFNPEPLRFKEIAHGIDDNVHVPDSYSHQVLLRWGDKLFSDAPDFDPQNQTAASQEKQFGYNNDFIAFLPFKPGDSTRGLLAVNHEYTTSAHMFPGSPWPARMTKKLTDAEIMAVGMSIDEVRFVRSKGWEVVLDSSHNRRITPWTPMRFDGPALGHSRLNTLDSKNGTVTKGTYGNCAGGVTPWGTVLTAEENVQSYFQGVSSDVKEIPNYTRFGIRPMNVYNWGAFYDRWDLAKEPRAANHVGWIVEVDPFDPKSTPVKHTALGRFKHEGCNVHINKDGRVVAYSGDDQYFEYVYRFVSKNVYKPGAEHRAHNMALLSEGTLSVAHFGDNGKLQWRDLVHGQGPLTTKNGFESQADVVIDARRAADLLGATPMDRPEEVEINPNTGSAFVILTKNRKRGDRADAANPRAKNLHGHIIEMRPPRGDHAASEFKWDIFLAGGDPKKPEHQAKYHKDVSENGWLACPDNCAFDSRGRIWIATDGAPIHGFADGLWASEVRGKDKALTRHFLRTPRNAELCGPCFTPDDKNLFCAVQHPGERGSFDKPETLWPDFQKGMPPRPSVIVVRKDDGGIIGS